MNKKKMILFGCVGVSLLFLILGSALPSVSRWMYLPGLLGYAGCTAVMGLGEWEKKHKIMAVVWWAIALMAMVLGIVQAAVPGLGFRFNPLLFIIILLLSMFLGWEEKPKTEGSKEEPKDK